MDAMQPASDLKSQPAPKTEHQHGVRPVPAWSVHLDAVRGIAALAVVLGHARDLFVTSPRELAGLTPHPAGDGRVVATLLGGAHPLTIGHEAVIVFFVLSGFLVGGSVLKSIQKQNFSWRQYFLRRVARLWVVLIPALLIGGAIDHIGLHHFSSAASIYGGPAGQGEVGAHLQERLGPSVFLGNVFFLQQRFVPTFGTNVALWSLAYEFWYYVAFPFLALLLFQRSSSLRKAGLFLGLCAALFVAGGPIALYFPIWLMGAAIAWLPKGIPTRWQQSVTAVSLAIYLITNLLLLKKQWPLTISDFTLAAIFSGFLYSVAHLKEPIGRSIYRRVSAFFAGISYTLYANHLPLLVLGCAVLLTPWHRWSYSVGHLAMVGAVIALTLVVTWGYHAVFEANTDRIRSYADALLDRVA